MSRSTPIPLSRHPLRLLVFSLWILAVCGSALQARTPGNPQAENSSPDTAAGPVENAGSSVAPPAVPVAEPPAIRSTEEVRNLSAEQLKTKPRVDIEGIILDVPGKNFPGWPPPNPQLYQDGTAVFVFVSSLKPPPSSWLVMEPGDRVRIQGWAAGGNFAPLIIPEALEFLGRGDMPPARPIAPADLMTGVHDGQWVSVSGVIQALWEPVTTPPFDTPYHTIQLGSPQGGFRARLAADLPPSLLGSTVRLRGVCLPYLNQRGEVISLLLHLNSLDDITVLEPGPVDPFAAPEVKTSAMRPFDIEDGLSSSRRLLRGVVTYVEPGSHLYLQADERGVKVGLGEGQTAERGDLVEASGFVRMVDGFAQLDYSLVRTIGKGELPKPFPVDSDSVLVDFQQKVPPPPDVNCRVVSLRGTLLKAVSDPTGKQTLWVEAGGSAPLSFPVTARANIPVPRPGSKVEVVGVCELIVHKLDRLVAYARPSDMRLFLASEEDLHVLSQPPWWTPARLWMLVGCVAAAFGLAMLQVRSLRNRVRAGSAALAAAIVGQRAAEARAEERVRLAEEVHDIMAQSLTGAALQMSAAEMASAHSPSLVAGHLKLASSMLGFARNEIRRTLFNLRSGLLDESDLSRSLKAMIDLFGRTDSCRVELEVSGTPQLLHPLSAHSLLRVVQEAMTNSVSHGKATRIEIRLDYSDGGIALKIEDNGQGENSQKRRGPAQGHFGLEGMRGRVRRLGGEFSFASVSGQGATVEARVPRQPEPGSGGEEADAAAENEDARPATFQGSAGTSAGSGPPFS